MNLRSIRQKARDTIHRGMSLPALYSDSDVTNVPVDVRHHRKSAYLGDEYAEYSPGYFSQINRVIIDLRQVTPKFEGSIIFLDEVGDPIPGSELKIENVVEQGEYKVLCEVR